MYKLHLKVATVLPQAFRGIEPDVAKLVVTYLSEKIWNGRGRLKGLGCELARGLRNLVKSEDAIGSG